MPWLRIAACFLWVVSGYIVGASAEVDAVQCSGSYVPGVIQKLPQTPKSGFGVLFVANHGDPEQHKHYIHQAVQSAQSYARVSPQLPLALITNAHPRDLPASSPFTRIIHIPSCMLLPAFTKPQKLTRTLTYHLTPFELTLAVDLDTWCCENLYPVLQRVFETQRDSFVMASAGHEQVVWHPDHGVKLYWWSDAMRKLLDRWEDAQVELGVASSDQIALMHAVRAHPEVDWRFSRLPSVLSCRIRPGRNESFAMDWYDRRFSQSLPLTGPLLVIHMAGLEDIHPQVCHVANSRAGETRVVTFRHSPLFPTNETVGEAFRVAYNQGECEAQMGAACLPGLDWTPRPFAITPVDRRDYEW